MKIIFARHGKDDDRYRGGWSDSDLMHEGVLQAEKLAEHLIKNEETYKISYIVSSDLKRAISTSEIIANKLGVSIFEGKLLREINNGDLAGMPNREAEIRYPKLYFNSLEMNEKYPNGESPGEFYERVNLWFKDFVDEHKNDSKNI